MVGCELCGKINEDLVNIKVAGTNMNVCNNCKNMGKESINTNQRHSFRKYRNERIEYDLVDNYLKKMNSALSKKGINLQQLARGINIKESTLQKYFVGKLKLDLDNAKKIASFFEIELIQEFNTTNSNKLDEDNNKYILKEDQFSTKNQSNNSNTKNKDNYENLSLGDLIKKQMNDK